MAKAVVLLSGGLDSSTVLALALEAGDEVTALSFDYGQRHSRELRSAQALAEHYGVRQVLSSLNPDVFRSSLVGEGDELPQERDPEGMAEEIPSTYVPARNIIMLSIAAGLCESLGGERIYLGANIVDYSGYPDCRPAFIAAFQEMLRQGTQAGVEGSPIQVETPIMSLSKGGIVKEALRLQVPLELTWSCYEGGEEACGVCDSCLLRLRGFQEAGAEDPLPYRRRK